jgi:hypothetical protein
MKTVMVEVKPWPKEAQPKREYKPKKPRPNPRIFKPKPAELDYFREAREQLAEIKRQKEKKHDDAN